MRPFLLLFCAYILSYFSSRVRTVGAMAGFHSAVAFHPGTGYGVVVLLGGHYPDAAKLAYDAFEIFQPAIDRALADLSTELYVGKWEDPDASAEKKSAARIVVEKGTLYIEELMLQGTNALEKFGARGRLALRSSMRRDELRCAHLDFAWCGIHADRASQD